MVTNWKYGVFLLFWLCVQPLFATQELNRKEYESLMESGRNGMIKFYQPWCSHCTRLRPDWDLLAENAPESVFVADVNCEVEEALCADHHTGGTYPTILVFRHGGNPELYQGGLGFEDLLRYADDNLAVPCNLELLEKTCSAKEQKYVSKWIERGREAWSREVRRLSALNLDDMTFELARWLKARIRILEQLRAGTSQSDTDEEL